MRPGAEARRASVRPVAALLVAAAGLLACGPPAVREQPIAPGLAGLGDVRHLRVPAAQEGAGGTRDAKARGHQTRPCVVLRSGEKRACDARLSPGSSLRFAVALDGARPGSALALEVRVEGRLVFERIQGAPAARSFAAFDLPLEGEGRRRIEFSGRILPPGDAPAQPGVPEGRILLGSARIFPASASRPRRVLVWISQDTVRADHLGMYGYQRATSPALDGRSAEWVVFEDAVATASWTLPALVSQFTGRYPSRHAAVLDDRARDADQASIFQVLAAHGFAVLGVTANRFVSGEFQTADGFDVLSFTTQDAAEVNRLALRDLENWSGGDLALFVHYMDAHFPYEAPAPYRGMFAGSYRGDVDGRNFIGLAPNRARPEDVAHVQALYDAELAYTDKQIHALLGALGQRGLLEGAVIVYSADHGEGFLEHGKWRHARTVYQELLHVPLAISVPGIRPRRVPEPVSMVDLAPTLLDVLGIPAPASMEGRSLKPLLAGGRAAERPIYAETEETTDRATHKLALRSGSLKYILTSPRAEGASAAREELFDLRTDPGERSPLPLSLAGSLPRLAQAYLAAARGRGRRPPNVILSPEDRESLRALGYAQQ